MGEGGVGEAACQPGKGYDSIEGFTCTICACFGVELGEIRKYSELCVVQTGQYGDEIRGRELGDEDTH